MTALLTILASYSYLATVATVLKLPVIAYFPVAVDFLISYVPQR